MREAGLALLMPKQRDYGPAIGVPEEPVGASLVECLQRWVLRRMKIIR